jgi:hypothetical protein
MPADYYATLGVAKDATDADLKKGETGVDVQACEGIGGWPGIGRALGARTAPRCCVFVSLAHSLPLPPPFSAYRKLAMKWHPVRGGVRDAARKPQPEASAAQKHKASGASR